MPEMDLSPGDLSMQGDSRSAGPNRATILEPLGGKGGLPRELGQAWSQAAPQCSGHMALPP